MRPIKDRVIIQAHYDQKEYIVYGKLKLIIPNRDKYNEDARFGNPVVAEVVAVHPDTKGLSIGDKVVLHHNSIVNASWLISLEDSIATLSIPVNRLILGKLDNDGNVQPLFNNMVCQRIEQPPLSLIIITPDAYKKNEKHRVKVLRVPEGEEKIKPGQTAIIYEHGDYECHYQFNGEERSEVVVYREDIAGVLN